MSEKVNSTATLKWLFVIYSVLVIILYTILWSSLHDNINQIKDESRASYEALLTKKDYGPFKIELGYLNKKQVIIDPKEVEKINNHIKVLTEEVQKESNRAESIVDKDLDRLNLYLAIGIGFMTLLGIFVPVLMNILSVQDLKDKQSEIANKLMELSELKKDIENAVIVSEKAISSANQALKKSEEVAALSVTISSIDLKTKKAIPEICNLILQSAIGRFFTISPIVLTNAIRDRDYQHFINLLTPIKQGFEDCKNDVDHHIRQSKAFQNTIDGFILFLKTEKFRFNPVFGTKAINQEFDQLIDLLQILNTSTKDKEVENYDNVLDQIEQIIDIFESKKTILEDVTV